MFPYANDEYSMWTGYFTSRANNKAYFKRLSQIYHSFSKLITLEFLKEDTDINVNKEFYQLANQLGIVQHHDAITGTSTQRVADDYSFNVYK